MPSSRVNHEDLVEDVSSLLCRHSSKILLQPSGAKDLPVILWMEHHFPKDQLDGLFFILKVSVKLLFQTDVLIASSQRNQLVKISILILNVKLIVTKSNLGPEPYLAREVFVFKRILLLFLG